MPSSRRNHKLLVEGADDQHSILHLLIRHGFDWGDAGKRTVEVAPAEGLTGLLETIPVALKSRYDSLGFVVDADENASDRWKEIRSRARRAGLDLPEHPDPEGTMVPSPYPESRVGFWLMPDNSSPGTLEHFLEKLVPDDDPVWAYSGDAVSEARRRGARCREADHLKSTLHTWLAWQETPGLPFGTALKAQVLRHESPDALRFVDWFRRLFE